MALTRRELLEALLAGETIRIGIAGVMVKLGEDGQIYRYDGTCIGFDELLAASEVCSIYKPKTIWLLDREAPAPLTVKDTPALGENYVSLENSTDAAQMFQVVSRTYGGTSKDVYRLKHYPCFLTEVEAVAFFHAWRSSLWDYFKRNLAK